MLGGCIVKKVRTLGTKRWVCAILVCALLLTTPSLALAASTPEQTAAQPLTLESIPAELAQTLELDELSPLAELNDTDEEQLNSTVTAQVQLTYSRAPLNISIRKPIPFNS